MAPLTRDTWTATRGYLKKTADRFAELAESSDPHARATADWSVADTVAHVATLTRIGAALVDSDLDGLPFPGVGRLMEATIVDTVADFNEVLLQQFTERDPRALTPMVRADIDQIWRATETRDPDRAVPWLGGSEVPLAGVLAHLLNELQIHGRDIARSTRSPWTVPAREAAPFFESFLVGVTRHGYGRLLDGHGPAPKGRVTVEFRSEYTTPVMMAMNDGFVTIEEPVGAPDVRLGFDPTTLNLVLFGRVSRPRAVLTGKVTVRGRRPWVLPAFLRIVRLPS